MRSKLLALTAAIILSAGSAWSEPLDAGAHIEVRVVAELRITEGSARSPRYRYVPAKQVVEGQELYYTVYVRNAGAEPAANVAVVRPIPDHTRYLANTAAGAGASISFSADGGKTFATADKLRMTDAGKAVRVPPERYTHIRWQWRQPLSPGAVVLARFRAVFD